MLMMCWGVGFGQQPQLAWARNMGGTLTDVSRAIARDAAGNVYTTGYFSDTADFDPGPGTFNLIANGGQNMFISKLDAMGNFVWAKRMGSAASDWANSIAVDATGNVYITGKFSDTVDFDPGPGVFNLTPVFNSKYSFFADNVFICKLDGNGNFVWAKSMGGPSLDWGNSIFVDNIGNVYTTGKTLDTADFDPGPGTFYLANSIYTYNSFISKLDAAGNFVWAKSFSSSVRVEGVSIVVDALGNVYTTGIMEDSANFDPGMSNTTLVTNGGSDIFISKLDAAGNFLWAKSVGGFDNEIGRSMYTDLSGNVYTTGTFGQSVVDFDPGPGIFNLSQPVSQSYFILKLDPLGNFVWAKDIPVGGQFFAACDISGDSFGNIYTTGTFTGTRDLDPGAGVYNLSSAGSKDIFIQKIDSSGNFKWAKNMGGSADDAGMSLCVDAVGEVYATGYFTDIADFDPSAANYYLTSAGDGDVFVLKLSQSPLPLHLLTFSAKRANNTNLLNWTTAQEVNTDRFDIERSPNGREFSKIGTVKTNSNNGQYNYTDNNPFASPLSNTVGEGPGVRFYRLKMIDKDGQFTYSPIRQLTINNSQFTISIFPNPVHSKLQLQINNDKKTTLQLDIITQDGKVVLSSKLSATEGAMLRSINVAALQSGTYFLRVTSGSGEQSVVKFEKMQ